MKDSTKFLAFVGGVVVAFGLFMFGAITTPTKSEIPILQTATSTTEEYKWPAVCDGEVVCISDKYYTLKKHIDGVYVFSEKASTTIPL